jgi:putative restriction endonuclease
VIDDADLAVRTAAFRFLDEQSRLTGEDGALRRELLARGFVYSGQRVPLLGPQGIFKPKVLRSIPLSIRTAAVKEGEVRPYDDAIGEDGLLRYRYRGSNPAHHENAGLRLAMEQRVPLIYLHGIVPGLYAPVWPVFVVGDDPRILTFTVNVNEGTFAGAGAAADVDHPEIRRRYATRMVRQRLHQTAFRERVVRAYEYHCAICRLKRNELLEAAHITPDADPLGEPVVPNGVSLCKLHHAAFDTQLIGIRPDYIVQVWRDVLDESDGPMLIHGLQGFHDKPILVPRHAGWRPNQSLLEERFERFLSSGL